jgi:hypothetical protein
MLEKTVLNHEVVVLICHAFGILNHLFFNSGFAKQKKRFFKAPSFGGGWGRPLFYFPIKPANA